MARRRRRSVRKLTFAALMAVSFLMALLPESFCQRLRGIFWPLLAPAQHAGTFVSLSVAAAVRKGPAAADLPRQIEKLKRQLHAQQAELASLYQALDVREQTIRRLARLRTHQSLRDCSLLPARVIGFDSASWRDSILINRGRQDGVRVGQWVVSDNCIVGRVVETGEVTAQVQLPSDVNFRLTGRIVARPARQRGGVVCGLKGLGRGRIAATLVSIDHDVKVGEMILADSNNNGCPLDLAIAFVSDCGPDPKNAILWRIRAVPAVDVGSLREVVVVLAAAEPRTLGRPGETLR